MTHGIPDAERLEDLKDAMDYAEVHFENMNDAFKRAELAFSDASIKRERASRELAKRKREYETFKSALAGMKDGRYA